MSTDNHERAEQLGKYVSKLLSDPQDEAVLSVDEIYDSDDLDELLDKYQDTGADVETVDEAYEQAMKDQYTEIREEQPPADDPLPAESVEVRFEDGNETYEGEVYIHGIHHGQPPFLPLSEEARDDIQGAVDEIAGPNSPVYLETMFNTVVVEGLADENDYVTEMDDDEVLTSNRIQQLQERIKNTNQDREEEIEDVMDSDLMDSENIEKLHNVLGAATTFYNEVDDGKRSDLAHSYVESLRDTENFADLQNLLYSLSLPPHLQEDHHRQQIEQVEEEAREKRQELMTNFFGDDDYDLGELVNDGFEAVVEPAVEKQMTDLKSRISWKRSTYMAQKGLEAITEGNDEVHLVVGAGHQKDIDFYLQENDPEDILDRSVLD